MMGEKNSLEKFGILDIPKGWQIKKLKDILIEGRLGGNYENAEANNGVPVIKMGNLDRATIKIDKIQYLPENETYNQEDVLVKGDLLFNTRNTLELVGKVAIWNNELPFAVYNSNLMRMKFDSSFVESTWFMNRAFNSYYGLRQLRGIATGTTSVAAIYGRDLESIKFLLPPLSEQKAIAQVLSTADAAIHTTEKLITQKELRKKWLMQQLLTGKKRLKGFGGEWKEYLLGDLGETYTGLTGKNKDDFGEGKPYIPYLNIFNNASIDILDFDFVRITESDNQNRVKYGDIFFTVSSETPDEVGMASVMLDEVEELYLNSFCFGFRLHNFNVLIPEFSSYFFRADEFRKEIFKLSQGATRYNLSKNNLMKLNVVLPPRDEQTAIAQVLQAADKEISLLKQKAEKLREQKKGLMQQLLTGKKRLNQDFQDLMMNRITKSENNQENPGNSVNSDSDNNLNNPKIR